MHILKIRLFGEFTATDHRGNALSIGSTRTKALIIYLALRLDGGATLVEIGEAMFGSRDAVAEVNELIADLRYALRFIPSDVLLFSKQSLAFNPAVVSVDTEEFESIARLEPVESLSRAAELYEGNLLAGYSTGIKSLDEFIAQRRIDFQRTAVAVLGRLLALQIKAGWWDSAIETAARLLSLDPSQEVVHRTLMRLQLDQGRPDSALRRYQECADILRRDYSRAPAPETERLRQQIEAELDGSPAPREMQKVADAPILVLLVEDDLVSSALLEGFLMEAGYGVVAVTDGTDALMEMARHVFDLLIIDVNLPTLNGLQLFEIMIQKGIATPALFISGIAGPETEARSLEMGAADFIRKPIRKATLLPRVRTILQRRDQRASGYPR